MIFQKIIHPCYQISASLCISLHFSRISQISAIIHIGNHSYQPSYLHLSGLLAIIPISHHQHKHWPSCLSAIIKHLDYQPSCLSNILPISHHAYWPFYLTAIKLIGIHAYLPSWLSVIMLITAIQVTQQSLLSSDGIKWNDIKSWVWLCYNQNPSASQNHN